MNPLSGVRPPPCLSGPEPYWLLAVIERRALIGSPLITGVFSSLRRLLGMIHYVKWRWRRRRLPVLHIGSIFPFIPLFSVFSACKSVLFSHYGEEVERFRSFPCSFFERMQMIIAYRPSPPHIHFPFFTPSVFPSSRSSNRREQ